MNKVSCIFLLSVCVATSEASEPPVTPAPKAEKPAELTPEAAKMHTEKMVKNLVAGLKAYQADYDRYPQPTSYVKGADTATTTDPIEMLVAILLGKEDNDNPRKIAYLKNLPKAVQRKGLATAGLEESDGDFGLYDPWGLPYQVVLDTDYDEKIENPEPGVKGQEQLNLTVIVWSGGPDHDLDTWEDNICSWKLQK